MAYSNIVLTAPSSAQEGETVSVSVKVTNISAARYEFRINLLAVRDIYAVPAPDEKIGSLEVSKNNIPLTGLNELEYIKGEIYANVWKTNSIARIEPQTGKVIGWIELTGLLSPEDYSKPVDVLNGIAYDKKNGRLFVTGKLWPKLFEIDRKSVV